jgi:hypothetical protein
MNRQERVTVLKPTRLQTLGSPVPRYAFHIIESPAIDTAVFSPVGLYGWQTPAQNKASTNGMGRYLAADP